MGCFLACFGSDKSRKSGKKRLSRDRSRRNYASLQPSSPLKPVAEETPVCSPLKQVAEETPDCSLLETAREKQEDVSVNGRRKVTFDLNVKTYNAEIPIELDDHLLHGGGEGDNEREENKAGKEKGELALQEDNSASSSSVSFPQNHRYGNCAGSNDETGYGESDLDDEDDDKNDDSDDEATDGEEDEEGEESFESYFSRSKENGEEMASVHLAKATDFGPTSFSPNQKPLPVPYGNARNRSQYILSVLNPVENLSQWKAVKAKPSTPLRQPRKENFDFGQELNIPFSEEPTCKPANPPKFVDSSPSITVSKQEISVDTSLSNWLISAEVTPLTKPSVPETEASESSLSQRSYSSKNIEDRPILGALTVEELRQSSASQSSLRRSPSQSPDEIPIVGSVGSYWNHNSRGIDASSAQKYVWNAKGIPNTTSKYGEDKVVNWHSTPFEVRLEKALTIGSAEASSRNPTSVC